MTIPYARNPFAAIATTIDVATKITRRRGERKLMPAKKALVARKTINARSPLQASTTLKFPAGMLRNMPSREIGTPDSLVAAIVKSAVKSISGGTRKSPAGTMKNRYRSG